MNSYFNNRHFIKLKYVWIKLYLFAFLYLTNYFFLIDVICGQLIVVTAQGTVVLTDTLIMSEPQARALSVDSVGLNTTVPRTCYLSR